MISEDLSSEQAAQVDEIRCSIMRLAVQAQAQGVADVLVLSAVGAGCIEVFKACHPHTLLPELLRREALRVERMIALDTAAARRQN